MSSGKQTSFAHGEVSPSLRYKSNAIAFSEGLYKLRNGVVRKDGGVSNRQGFRLITGAFYQDQIPSVGSRSDMSVKLASHLNLRATLNPLILGHYHILMFSRPSGDPRRIDIYNMYQIYDTLDSLGYSNGGKVRDMQSHMVGGQVLLSFGKSDKPNDEVLLALDFDKDTGAYSEGVFSSTPKRSGVVVSTLTSTGLEPLVTNEIPVAYMITQVLNDGQEILWDYAGFAKGHPHAQARSEWEVDIEDPVYGHADVRQYNIYRASGSNTSMFVFVGSVVPEDDSENTVNFFDFGVTGDPTNTPPMNPRLWGTQIGDIPWHQEQTLRSVRRICQYQQRLIVAYDEKDDPDAFSVGTIGVSKIGAPTMLHMPLIYTNTGAFEFKVPLDDGSPVVAMLPMERLLVFTERTAYVIRGNDVGLLTPTSINPQVISEEGCSKIVEPVMAGSIGFFVNADHSKILAVTFGENGSVTVSDFSVFSEHLVNGEDIVQMALVRGYTTVLWVLRKDGKFLSISITDSAAGFALHETDGHVESICKADAPHAYRKVAVTSEQIPVYDKPPQETLVISVIRNGVRYLEAMDPRNDEDDEGFLYCDSYKRFGKRLARSQFGDGSWVYVRPEITDTVGIPAKINITTSGTYEQGQLITLTAEAGPGQVIPDAGNKLDFFYYEERVNEQDQIELVKRFIRFDIVSLTLPADPMIDPYVATAYASDDVPEYLQDVANNADLDSYEKTFRMSWNSQPINQVTGLTHLAGRKVSVFADGQVLSSPNNTRAGVGQLEVSAGGVLDLGGYYNYGVVGLPYTFEMETLDIEAGGNRTLTDANKLITGVGVAVHQTRGPFVGNATVKGNLDQMTLLEQDDAGNGFDDPAANVSGVFNLPIFGAYSVEGRAHIKQVDPLPITVLAVYPKGIAGGN